MEKTDSLATAGLVMHVLIRILSFTHVKNTSVNLPGAVADKPLIHYVGGYAKKIPLARCGGL
jgi:hypothetical protein